VSLVLNTDPACVVFPQLLRAPLPDGRLLLIFSGVAVVDFRGESRDWNRDIVILALNTRPSGPYGGTFIHDQAAAFVTPNSTWDKDTAIDAGFAIDWCRALPHIALFSDWIFIECQAAVRDSDAFLYRVGYQLTATGKLYHPEIASEIPSRLRLDEEIKKMGLR